MYSTEFDPGIPDTAPLHEGATVDREGRQAGTPATLEANPNLLNAPEYTELSLQEQENRARWFSRQFGLSPSYAKAIASNLGQGAMS
jgi:hypothetical protein